MPDDPGRSQWRVWLLALVIACAVGMWPWSRGITGPYHFDDYLTPLNDPASQSLAAWFEYLPVTLRPATKLSYALEADAGWSREPAPRRLLSLALHAATALLLYGLIARVVGRNPVRARLSRA